LQLLNPLQGTEALRLRNYDLVGTASSAAALQRALPGSGCCHHWLLLPAAQHGRTAARRAVYGGYMN
jgi:hypothetical protein